MKGKESDIYYIFHSFSSYLIIFQFFFEFIPVQLRFKK